MSESKNLLGVLGGIAMAISLSPLNAWAVPVHLQCSVRSGSAGDHPLIVDLEKRTIQLNSLKFSITQISPKYITGTSKSNLSALESSKNQFAGNSGGETVVFDRNTGNLYRTSIVCATSSANANDNVCQIQIWSFVHNCIKNVL